jgi:hypothetical protein
MSLADVRIRDGVADQSGGHALAHTMGDDIATTATAPRAGRGRQAILAHELAHVAQQKRAVVRTLQPKLTVSGDTVGFAAFANGILAVQWEVVVSAAGEVSLRQTNNLGPPTPEATALLATLRASINDASTIKMEFIHGQVSRRPEDRNVLGGNYGLSRVDLDDLSALGTQGSVGVGMGRTGGSILVHEITEQRRKQVQGEAFGPAHAVATTDEEAAVGATRGAESYRQVSPTTLEVTIPYTYPNGRVVEVTWDIVDGNYQNVRRRVVNPGRP